MTILLVIALLLSVFLAWTGFGLSRTADRGSFYGDFTPGQIRRMVRFHYLAAVAVPACVAVSILGGSDLWAAAGPPLILLALAGAAMKTRRGSVADTTDGAPTR